MKRKFSSILLLISFMGLLIHDMVPHHHHEEAVGVTEVLEHSENSCSSNEVHEHLMQNCDTGLGELSDNNHECPHHLHSCLVTDIKILPSSNSTQTTQKSKLANLSYVSNKFSAQELSGKLKYSYQEKDRPIREIYLLGTGFLRGPPVVS